MELAAQRVGEAAVGEAADKPAQPQEHEAPELQRQLTIAEVEAGCGEREDQGGGCQRGRDLPFDVGRPRPQGNQARGDRDQRRLAAAPVDVQRRPGQDQDRGRGGEPDAQGKRPTYRTHQAWVSLGKRTPKLLIQVTVSELLRIADHLEPAGRELVRKAYERAATAHRGQRRLSGEDYVNHPLEVAAILADLQLDAQTLAAALLHDNAENTTLP